MMERVPETMVELESTRHAIARNPIYANTVVSPERNGAAAQDAGVMKESIRFTPTRTSEAVMSEAISRSTFKSEVAVLIVGAGPAGLTLALELQRVRVPYRITEQHAGPENAARAIAIHSRTLEIFRQLGIADRVI